MPLLSAYSTSTKFHTPVPMNCKVFNFGRLSSISLVNCINAKAMISASPALSTTSSNDAGIPSNTWTSPAASNGFRSSGFSINIPASIKHIFILHASVFSVFVICLVIKFSGIIQHLTFCHRVDYYLFFRAVIQYL